MPYASNKVYSRYSVSGDSWSAWTDDSNYLQVKGVVDGSGFNAAIASYTKGVSVSYIMGANASVTPDKNAGTLVTVRISDDSTSAYNYQMFISLANARIYVRQASGLSWGKWYEKGSNTYITDTNAYDCSTALSAFDFGVTHTPINTATASASGAPEASAGLLTTYKVGSNIFCHQDYRIMSSSKTYRRAFASDGTPTSWVKVAEL